MWCRIDYCVGVIGSIVPLAAMLVTASCSVAQVRGIDDSVIEQWNAYHTFSRQLQGKAARTATGLVSGHTYGYQSSFRQNRECAMICSPLGDQAFEFCMLANPRYTAEVKRSLSDPGKVLLQFVAPTPDATPPSAASPVGEAIFVETSPHFTYCSKKLAEVVTDPAFRVNNVTRVPSDGQELVRLDVSYVYDVGGNVKKQSKRKGSLYFDPKRKWCLRKVTESEELFVNGAPDQTTDWTTEYEVRDHASGFPIIVKQTITTDGYSHRSKRKTGAKIQIDYELDTTDKMPNADFTLSAFGLPEPVGVTWERPTPTYVWVLTAAGGCGLLALLFRYLGRRKPSASTA